MEPENSNLEKEYYRTIRMNIKRYRGEEGLSQEKLSEKIGKGVSYIRNIEGENSKTRPSLPALVKIAVALDVSLALLCAREEDKAEM